MSKRYQFIAIESATNRVFSFNGAYQMAKFIGIHHNTIYENLKKQENKLTDKDFKGFKIAKSENNPIKYENRGGSI